MLKKDVFRRKNESISAILGIILLVAITVIIIGVVYWFVTNAVVDDEPVELTVEGTVFSVVGAGTYNDTTIYDIKLNDNNTYQMLFMTEDAVVPPTGVHLRFYYRTIHFLDTGTTLFDVYKIKSL